MLLRNINEAEMRNPLHYGWFVVATLALMQAFTIGICLYGFALMVVPWMSEFGVTRGTVMITSLAMLIASMVQSPFVGVAFDTWKASSVITAGLLLFVLGLALISVATEWWQVLLICAIPFSAAMQLSGSLGAQVTVSKWFTVNRGVAVTLSSLGTAVGGLLAPPLIALLIGHYGWRHTYLILAAASLALTLLVRYVLRISPPASRLDTEVRRDESAQTSLLTIARAPQFWTATIGLALLDVVYLGVVHNIGAYSHDRGIDQMRTSGLISLFATGAIVGKFFWAGVVDRLQNRILFLWAAVPMAAGVVLVQRAGGYAEIGAGMVLIGISSSGSQPILVIGLTRFFSTESIGRALGLGFMVLTLGTSLGPVVAGFAFDHFGSYDPAFLLFLGLLALGAVITWVGHKSSVFLRPAQPSRHSHGEGRPQK
jgi:MFS family permease